MFEGSVRELREGGGCTASAGGGGGGCVCIEANNSASGTQQTP